MDSERARLHEHIDAQNDRVAGLLRDGDEDELARRPSPDRWSVAEHLAHVAVVNRLYVEELEPALDRARQGGPIGEGPYRRGPIGRLFVRAMAPPVKRRMKAPTLMLPPPATGADEAERDFGASQRALSAMLDDAGEVDLGRVMVRSPVVRVLRVRAIQAIEAVLAHTDRHLWLIDEMRAAPSPKDDA